jgi:hypothetical protein
MENKEIVEQVEEKKDVVTPNEVQKPEEKKEEKLLTQAQFDEAIKARLKGMPTKEELKEWNEYKQSLKTKEEKDKETIEDLAKTKGENLTLKQQIAILKKGILEDDTVEFIQFKLGKSEGDFSENLEKFLAENPKYTTKEEAKKTTTGYRQATTTPVNDKQDYLANKYKNNPWYQGK